MFPAISDRPLYRSLTSLARQTVSLFALLLLIGLMGLDSSVQAQDFNTKSSPTNSRMYHTRFQLGPGEGIREVTIEGSFRFSPDETEIEWIDDDAYLTVITQKQGQKLRFDAKADGQGQPTIVYKVDGQSQDYDKGAASYLAQILPVVFRELAHDEISRVQTTYDQEGADGVFRLISEIRSQYSIGLHALAFLRLEGLPDAEIAECYSLLGSHINSDYELASVMYATSNIYREHPDVRHAYLECLNNFQSDIERSRITQNLFGVEKISGDQQPIMAEMSEC